jgi:hypothetical protein
MMNIKRLLLAVVACCVISSSVAMVSSQQTNNNFGLEQERWAYIQENLGKCLGDSASIFNKMGGVLDTYAWMAPGVLYLANVVLSDLCLNILTPVHDRVDGFLHGYAGRRWAPAAQRIHNFIYDNESVVLMFVFLSLSYGLCKVIGQALERKTVRCGQVLTFFVSQWDKHKPYTPLAMQSLFDTLSQDLKKNGGRFSKINDGQARTIVENVLAYSVVASVIK